MRKALEEGAGQRGSLLEVDARLGGQRERHQLEVHLGRRRGRIGAVAEVVVEGGDEARERGWLGQGDRRIAHDLAVQRFRGGDRLDQAFLVGIVLKGLDGVLEVVGGLILLAVSPAIINHLAQALTQHELSEDPHDFIATHLLHAAGTLSGSAVIFGAVYLLSHGAVKIVLVGALLRSQVWAYPWMIAFLLLFAAYQVYRIALRFSVGLFLLTVFDMVVAWLTYREYQRHRSAPPSRSG